MTDARCMKVYFGRIGDEGNLIIFDYYFTILQDPFITPDEILFIFFMGFSFWVHIILFHFAFLFAGIHPYYRYYPPLIWFRFS